MLNVSELINNFVGCPFKMVLHFVDH